MLAQYDTKLQAHKHSVNKALKEMDDKIDRLGDRKAPDDLAKKTPRRE